MTVTADLRLGRWQDMLDAGPSRLADGSVRLLLTSPPYDNARTYEGTNEPVDFAELAAFALRVLCPGGTLCLGPTLEQLVVHAGDDDRDVAGPLADLGGAPTGTRTPAAHRGTLVGVGRGDVEVVGDLPVVVHRVGHR